VLAYCSRMLTLAATEWQLRQENPWTGINRLRKNAVPATVLGNCYIELTPQLPQTAMQTGFLE